MVRAQRGEKEVGVASDGDSELGGAGVEHAPVVMANAATTTRNVLTRFVERFRIVTHLLAHGHAALHATGST
jgi:hypothetical protein